MHQPTWTRLFSGLPDTDRALRSTRLAPFGEGLKNRGLEICSRRWRLFFLGGVESVPACPRAPTTCAILASKNTPVSTLFLKEGHLEP